MILYCISLHLFTCNDSLLFSIKLSMSFNFQLSFMFVFFVFHKDSRIQSYSPLSIYQYTTFHSLTVTVSSFSHAFTVPNLICLSATIDELSLWNKLWILNFNRPPLSYFCFLQKYIVIKNCPSSKGLSEYKIPWPVVDWCKFGIHFSSLNLCRFGMVEGTRLKIYGEKVTPKTSVALSIHLDISDACIAACLKMCRALKIQVRSTKQTKLALRQGQSQYAGPT
jgi:hypothetical protein